MRLDNTVDIDEAVTRLRQGELVAFPTETVYGLGADALNTRALDQLYRLKGRPRQHPVIVHMAHTNAMHAWVSAWPEAAQTLAEAFWPGPLTLILPKSDLVLDDITGGFPGVGLRIPRHPVALRLLDAFQGGIAAPSANRYGQLSPTQAVHVRQAFGQDCPALLEGGPSQVGLESTIVDLVDAPVIRRVGHITADQLSHVLGYRIDIGGNSPAPGTVKHHYAPVTPLMLIAPDALSHYLTRLNPSERIVLLTHLHRDKSTLPDNLTVIPMPRDAETYNRRLYAALHEADQLQVDALWVISPEREKTHNARWQAACDRLDRAAAATQQCTA